MDTVLGILSGENYFDTRVLADIVSVCLHRCQQPTKPKFYLFFSSTSNHVRVDVMCIHSYNMADKIKRMSVNVAFEYICQKEWNFLTYGRIVHLYMMY
jgi:hypothetical protein